MDGCIPNLQMPKPEVSGPCLLYSTNLIWRAVLSAYYLVRGWCVRACKCSCNSIDFASWVSYLNKFDLGISFKSGSVFSFLASVGLGENVSIAYAYDTYRNPTLSGLNLSGHELAIRFNLGEREPDDSNIEESVEE